MGAEHKTCRLCGLENESVHHFGKCTALRRVYESLRLVDGGKQWDDARLNLLGIQSTGIMKKGTAAIHSFTWKHVIPEMVRVETEKARFQTGAVLRRAAQRYKKREAALQVTINIHVHKMEARHDQPIDTIPHALERFEKTLDGIAFLTEEGQIVRTTELENWLNVAEAMDTTD